MKDSSVQHFFGGSYPCIPDNKLTYWWEADADDVYDATMWKELRMEALL